MKVAVIGAGPAGITAAYQLVKQGVAVEVFEAGNAPGGMAKTIELWGQRVDLGPHRFFSKDTRINKLWIEVVGQDFAIVNRLTRIVYNGKFFEYPLNPFNAFGNLGFLEVIRCGVSYLAEKISPTPQNGSFENWVVSRFGRRLFSIFFKVYSEKLWGIPCQEIDADFAAQRIKKLFFFEVVKKALFKGGRPEHKTLIEAFAYPLQGTGIVYERMAAFVESHGGKIHYGTPVFRVLTEDSKAVSIEIQQANGTRQVLAYDHIISSMPLTDLMSCLPHVPPEVVSSVGQLTFRNTILVYLQVVAADLFPDQWLYIQSREFKTGRVTNFRNWVPQLYGQHKTSIVAMEYWCNDGDPLWLNSDESLIALASREFAHVGFSSAEIVSGHVIRVPKCYPVYRKGYKQHLGVVTKYLRSIAGLTVIGRYGAFKYNNQDHSILMGILAAENLTQGAGHDLWSVNTDYEDYQESSVITKAGLVKH